MFDIMGAFELTMGVVLLLAIAAGIWDAYDESKDKE